MIMAWCFRCSTCGVDWPYENPYTQCLQCGDKTDRLSNGTPMTPEEANLVRLRIRFEAFYDRQTDHEFRCDCDRPDGLICWACDPLPHRPKGGRLVFERFGDLIEVFHVDGPVVRREWRWHAA